MMSFFFGNESCTVKKTPTSAEDTLQQAQDELFSSRKHKIQMTLRGSFTAEAVFWGV